MKGYIQHSTYLRTFKTGNRIIRKKKNDELKAASKARGENINTKRQPKGTIDGGVSRDQFGKPSPSKDVEGTKTLVVHGYPIETTEEEIRAAFATVRKPVATFLEEKHAAEALDQSMIGILQLRPMHVIWDWENCTIPTTFGVVDLYENVQKYLNQLNFYISCFDGYGDTKALNYAKFKTLSDQGKIKLHHVVRNKDDAADIGAKKALLQIMADRLPPFPSLVISGNRDFAKVIISLRNKNYEVYLAYNDKAQADLINSATKCFRYEDLFGIDREKLAKPTKSGGKARKARRLKRLRANQQMESEN